MKIGLRRTGISDPVIVIHVILCSEANGCVAVERHTVRCPDVDAAVQHERVLHVPHEFAQLFAVALVDIFMRDAIQMPNAAGQGDGCRQIRFADEIGGMARDPEGRVVWSERGRGRLVRTERNLARTVLADRAALAGAVPGALAIGTVTA